MKNRRSTIIIAIMVALVGTPRVWKEFGNILASLQHKTQNRLLSMAVNSQVRESNREEMAGTPMLPVHLASPCPAARFSQIADNRKSVDSSAPRKLKVEKRVLPNSAEFSTLASNSVSKKHQNMKLTRPEESLAWVGENKLAMHDIASVPREMLENNVTEFVALPQVHTVQTVFIEKNADLIKLKKSLEESKGLRQKVRYIISRNFPALPST